MKYDGNKVLAPGLRGYVDRRLISHETLKKCLRRYIKRRDRICSYQGNNEVVDNIVKEEYYVLPPE
ncbi:MAG TPA: hypothetical protein VJ485_02240 [archaeon]|jgi:hypothetical protein|nr:hypothetical protein [archaeon]